MTSPPLQMLTRQGAAAEKATPEDGHDAIARPPRPREEPAASSWTLLPPPLRAHALSPRSDVAYVPDFVSQREEEALLRHLHPTKTVGTAAADEPGGPSPPLSSSPAPGWRLVSGRRLRVLGGSVQGGALTATELPSWLLPLVERLRATGTYADTAEAEVGEKRGEGEEAQEGEKKRASCSSSASNSPSSCSPPPPPPPNHALVNCYSPGEGILPHEDGPLYHPAAAIVSLGSWAVLRFYLKGRSEDEEEEEEREGEGKEEEDEQGKEKQNRRNVFSVALAPRSLIIFTGEAYKSLLHGIEAVEEELLDASVLNREEESVREAAVASSADSSLRMILRGGASERISLTVRRVLRVRRNLLRLGPRLGPR